MSFIKKLKPHVRPFVVGVFTTSTAIYGMRMCGYPMPIGSFTDKGLDFFKYALVLSLVIAIIKVVLIRCFPACK